MEKYKIIKQLGGGSYGVVKQWKNTTTGEIVAIKQLKDTFQKWNTCVDLAEVKSLAKLNHPNIIRLLEVIKQNNNLYLVFEYMDSNLFQMTTNRKNIPEYEIRNIVFQILQGIYYMHRMGYMHRDIKPENILEFKGIVKIADFGLAKTMNAGRPLTEYISTRWYRAPELILSSNEYDCKIDIFAIGCIVSELYTSKPLFNGANQQDQIAKVLNILGTPNILEWEEGYRLAKKLNFTLPSYKKQSLKDIIPTANEDAIDLISKMLIFDSKKRISALEALQHQYFSVDIPMTVSTDQTARILDTNLSKPDLSSKPMAGPAKPSQLMPSEDMSAQQQRDESKKKIQSTKHYIMKARYKKGVNIQEILKQQQGV